MFPLGGLALTVVTVNFVHMQVVKKESMEIIQWLFLLITVFFAFLLIYTLFFAIPFDASYSAKKLSADVSGQRLVCRSGVYALCRHPGVLWMAGMYFFLWVAIGGTQLCWLFVSTTICNFTYVIFQDVWTFPKLFTDYENYRKEVPFLIPTKDSIVQSYTQIISKKG